LNAISSRERDFERHHQNSLPDIKEENSSDLSIENFRTPSLLPANKFVLELIDGSFY